jgi:hypothetical protein
MNMHIPDQEGEYLFYFGNSDKPFYQVDTLRFTDPEVDIHDPDSYLENNDIDHASMWWHLPKPHVFNPAVF